MMGKQYNQKNHHTLTCGIDFVRKTEEGEGYLGLRAMSLLPFREETQK